MPEECCVYIVDDDKLLLETLSDAFETAHYKVLAFSEPSTFLEHVESIHDNSCLILDLSMPEYSGLEIQSELLKHGTDIPIIIYSGKADIQSTVKAMEGGAVTLLQKPVSIATLIDKVQQAMDVQQKKLRSQSELRLAKTQIKLLSKRELTIASMVADGCSAQEIADQLFISHRTVEAHKAKIFNKLAVKSVAALTRVVLLASNLKQNH